MRVYHWPLIPLTRYRTKFRGFLGEAYQEMGIGRPYPRQDKQNNKGDRGCHTKGQTDRQIPCQPARLCTEEEASVWFTPGSGPWYYAQGLTPPGQEAEKTGEDGC
jgi:hypothetical protein